VTGVTARGRFITIEGIEGVGKSSHVAALRDTLVRHGYAVELTREPGGTRVADRIRELVLKPGEHLPTADTELLLIFAARAEHLAQRIEPALAAGTWVVCDRFTDATYAYQGGGQGAPSDRIRAIEAWVQGARQPDRTLLLDAPVETALARVRDRGQGVDRFEAESVAFFERARATYLERARASPERFRVIDANAAIDSVRARVLAAIVDLTDDG